MLLDNRIVKKEEQDFTTVAEFLKEYLRQGNIDIVTGYFNVTALAYLADIANIDVNKFRFIIGDIVKDEKNSKRTLNLLTENRNIKDVLELVGQSKAAVKFLKQAMVEVKILEPNFCHAKLYLQNIKKNDPYNFYISGSSNLTSSGIGLNNSKSNIELNIANTGSNNEYEQLVSWFNELWQKPEAYFEKTIVDENGKTIKISYKQYLIDIISQLFALYTPEQVYFKILFELFYQKNEDPAFERKIGKLENTKIYGELYDFQRSGAKSLIRMLEKYNGAIMADAVGLGKTWSALAVMKYYQMQGFEVILLCPKKLQQNWSQYLKRGGSKFEDDKFDYLIRFHTDLREDGLSKDGIHLDFFTNDKPKLFVIDESHNLRNDKSSRYNYLVDEVLQKSRGDIKMLLLSATPINNSFKDVRNQFKLMVRGENDGFKETLDIKNLEHSFRVIQKLFNGWTKEENATLADFYANIKDSDFFRLTDKLLVARTRKSIADIQPDLVFPKHHKPINIFKTPFKFGDFDSFQELLEKLNINLSAYQPSFYTESLEDKAERKKLKQKNKDKGIKEDNKAILVDDVQREFFLVKMMNILMFKRLESSWHSFHITIGRIYEHHKNTLKKIEKYEVDKIEITLLTDTETQNEVLIEDLTGKLETILINKKSGISLAQIDGVGMLKKFKTDIKNDKNALKIILDSLVEFSKGIENERNTITKDIKLDELLKIVATKKTKENKKILIFTAYKDTAEYLYKELDKRGFKGLAMVAGDTNIIQGYTHKLGKHALVLERFAPFTKLFNEKKWEHFEPSETAITPKEKYEEWIKWVEKTDPATFHKVTNPIDILIATDVLSEGQNLQDADMVINYDIHWNPVRVIQRVGRIDRIGSPNDFVQSINFWPSKDINDYINLKGRVEQRMAAMKLAGSEVIDAFTDEFDALAKEEDLEARQNANMMLQMESSMEEIDGEKSLGFDDMSFNIQRELLDEMLNQKRKEFENMPHGVFSGFKIDADENDLQPGLIALLGYPAMKKYDFAHEYKAYELIYIDNNGAQISNNQKIVLDLLQKYYKKATFVATELANGEEQAIKPLQDALKKWVENQAKAEEIQDDGSVREVASQMSLDFIQQLQKGSSQAIKTLKTEGTVSEKFQYDNFDLITWLVVS